MKDVTQLHEGWNLRHEDGLLPATVPGCVHTDLLASGAIADPFIGHHEAEIAWVGRQAWSYVTEPVHDSAHERTELVFEGLDTAAEVFLDGASLGATRNMHRVHRFDVTGRTGPLEVRFSSAYEEAERVRALTGDRPNVYPEPFQYIRKMACSFGWDWGPTVVTAGMWRPVRLEHWSTARLSEVRPLVTVDGTTGRVELRVRVARTESGAVLPLSLRATVSHAGSATNVETSGETPFETVSNTPFETVSDTAFEAAFDGDEAVVVLEVPEARLWWPRGYGQQPLYELDVTLLDEDGAPLDTWSRRIGFRTVEVDRSTDEHGTGFTFVVNGVRIFARGVNWIPDDVLPSRVTPDRYRTRLTQAAEANIDLVRIWGGGIYEDDAFYDVCDELGLMVWQDFLFACAAYPEEQPLRGEVEAEARDNVVRLMPHPSLVLWNGNNENLWGFRDWEWETPLAGDSWGEGYYLGILPRIVAELDPTRPYTAGSPWSGSWDHHPNDPRHGTHHSWEVWNRQDYAEYRANVPRFCAEFGWQAPPALATLRRALPDEVLAPDSPGMLHHQKAEDGNGKLNRGIDHHFGLPENDFDRWHYLAQVVQARAVAAGIEHWRANWPVCAGTVVWQLNDCWPVSSWAAIDGDGRLKPLYHELRRVYADRVLSLVPDGEGPVLALDNQSGTPWRTTVTLRRVHADGTVLREATFALEAAARTVVRLVVPAALLPEAESAEEFLVADADDLRAVHFPVLDREFAYPSPQYDVRVETGAGSGTVDVVVTARTLVRDLLLQPDRLGAEASADRGLLTLLPGEEARIAVTGLADIDVSDVRNALFSVGPA